MRKSNYSQLGQELWVKSLLNDKTNGIFIEVGASNGHHLSNTCLLEKDHQWTGLCIEPSSKFEELKKNRQCETSSALIYSENDIEVEFIEDTANDDFASFSGIKNTIDKHQIAGSSSIRTTSTLTRVLDELNFADEIDYLSIDTEGSELHVLKGIDFKRYHFSLITVEHNWVEPKRSQIRQLLHKHGYQQDVLVDSRFDDWYIHYSLLNKTENPYLQKADKLRAMLLTNFATINGAQTDQMKIEMLEKQIQEKEEFIQNQNRLLVDQHKELTHLRDAINQLKDALD